MKLANSYGEPLVEPFEKMRCLQVEYSLSLGIGPECRGMACNKVGTLRPLLQIGPPLSAAGVRRHFVISEHNVLGFTRT